MTTEDKLALDIMLLSVHIPLGAEHAISREELARKLGMSDRHMRAAISDARRAGLIILNRQDGRGYYRSADVAELKRQLTQIHHRAVSLLAQEKPIKDQIAEAEARAAHYNSL